jgi:tetratricopeptide (TPR) repeat protein
MAAPTYEHPKPKILCGRSWGICLALAAITFAVFGQTLNHEFINFDDNDYVYGNPVVAQGLTGQGLVWAGGVHAENWHPLTWLSHMLDCQIYGLHPGGHHLTNVLLHAATVIALFLILRRMTGATWRCAFVAAVFAIHPLRVESVAWVAERKDVLSGLFFMLTIGAYVCYARGPRTAGRYGLVALLFALGLMCKPMLVTLPVVLLLLDRWPLQRAEPTGKLLLEKLSLFALSAASCAATLWAQTALASPTGAPLPLSLRCANAAVGAVVYLGQMVWPSGLALIYPYAYHGLAPWKAPLALALLAVLTGLALWQRRRQPWLLTGWLWYLVMLLPVAGIIQVGHQAHADRYTYLPQIGIYLALTWLAAGWCEKAPVRRQAVLCAVPVLLAALMFVAWRQTACWQNSETVWSHTVAVTDANDIAHVNLGAAFLQKGRLDDAISEYQRALLINPAVAETEYDLGSAYLQEGQVDAAAAHFQSALQINPSFAPAHFSLGNISMQNGQMDDAISQYQAALKINPANPDAHLSLGNALMAQARSDEAILHFRAAVQLRPEFAQAHNNLGNALMQKGQIDEAIAHFQAALAVRPDYAKARINLDHALSIKGTKKDGK